MFALPLHPLERVVQKLLANARHDDRREIHAEQRPLYVVRREQPCADDDWRVLCVLHASYYSVPGNVWIVAHASVECAHEVAKRLLVADRVQRRPYILIVLHVPPGVDDPLSQGESRGSICGGEQHKVSRAIHVETELLHRRMAFAEAGDDVVRLTQSFHVEAIPVRSQLAARSNTFEKMRATS